MSLLRHRFRVVVDGQTYEFRTSARDMANAETDGADPRNGGIWTTLRLVHTAMIRLDLPVPTDLDAFVDVLDEVEDQDEPEAQTEPEAQDAEPDPTHAVV